MRGFGGERNINLKFSNMKNSEITIKVLEFENGHILLSVDDGLYYVKTSEGVFIYNSNEMLEIYDFTDK